MFLNALLEESAADETRFIEVSYSGGLLTGRVTSQSLDGEMFGFVKSPSNEVVYVAKEKIFSVRFVEEESSTSPDLNL